MLWGIFRFELAYQARRAWPWLLLAALLVVSFLLARDTSFAEAQFESFHVNAPFTIAKNTVIGGLFWLLAGAVVAGEAGARDVATGMHPLTYTTAATKGEYLGGRFLAAFAINALLLFGVQVAQLVAFAVPGIDPASLGPFRPAAYLTAYAFIALPNALAATAIQFALAARSGRTTSAYLGSLLLVFVAIFIGNILLYKRTVGSLLDPTGMRYVIEDLAHRWTSVEKNVRLVGLDGPLLANRLAWLGITAGVLGLTYARFRLAHRVDRAPWWRRVRRRREGTAAAERPAARAAVAVPAVERATGPGIELRRTLAIAGDSWRAVASSWAGIAMLVGVPLLTILVVIDQMQALGAPLVPGTARVLRELTGGLTADLAAEPGRWIIVPLLVVFFAGELAWRERDAGIAEIADAMPGSEWAPFLGKLLGLALVLATFLAALAGAGSVAQLLLGHRDVDLALYATVLLGLQLPEHLLFAVLALAVHAFASNKYLGHLLAILAYAFIAALAGVLGIEHHLLVYDRGPGWNYTEMRGFGATLAPWAWFKAYWAAWAVLLAVAARLLWVRGREAGGTARLREARARLARPTLTAAAAGAGLVLALGGFIFWNTNVLHPYDSSAAVAERRAEYERRWRRFETAPQPRLRATSLRVELYPERRQATIAGTHRLANEGDRPIDSVLVNVAATAETRAIAFDRAARLAVDDREHATRLYVLERPLAPGDTLRMTFDVRIAPRGFTNGGTSQAVLPNGSALTGATWIPLAGYLRSRELLTSGARAEHGLPPRPILGALYDVEGSEPATRGGGVAFEAVVGTSDGQVAVAPGALKRAWSEGGRRRFHYATSAPIGTEWSFFSARFAVREERWTPPPGAMGGPVTIRIHHHPSHDAHLPGTVRALRASMDHHAAHYGPYPYDHLTVVEQPGAPGNSAHADASMITHGESFAAWTPRAGRLDMPFFVVAHEMGHQWGMPYALVEGLPFMAEGLATYQAMQVVRATHGERGLRQLMAFMRLPFPYPPMRRGQPLLRALDPHMARRKGPFAMWLLRETMGAERVDGALRRLTLRSDSAGAPPVTTLDLYRELRAAAPDSLHPLLADLFERNVAWQLATRRARADSLGDGRWRVTLDVRARRTVYDSTGVERALPMDEWVPVGVFARGEPGDELGRPLHLAWHRVRSGEQSIVVTVAGRPVLAGIDPHHLMDWEEHEDDDNVEAVETAGSRSR